LFSSRSSVESEGDYVFEAKVKDQAEKEYGFTLTNFWVGTKTRWI
jgi:hypothetical protein